MLRDIDGDPIAVQTGNGMISIQFGKEIREFALEDFADFTFILNAMHRQAVDALFADEGAA